MWSHIATSEAVCCSHGAASPCCGATCKKRLAQRGDYKTYCTKKGREDEGAVPGRRSDRYADLRRSCLCAEPASHQVFGAACDDQFLRSWTERRKGE
jgi:hypothetical protein